MVNIAAIFIGLVGFAMAGLVGRKGYRQHRRRRLVAETETTDVLDIDSERLVELTGAVDPVEPIRSPIGDEECVLAAWEIEEWDESGQTDMWETRASGVYAAPFTLTDGTGEVRVAVGDHVAGDDADRTEISLGPVDLDRLASSGVAAESAFCSLEDFTVAHTVPPDADPPAHIAEFVGDESDVSEQTDSITNVIDIGTAHNERRYYEGTIDPGQEIYLLGEARATSDAAYPLGPDDVVIRPPADDGSLIVSDRSEDELLAELGAYRWLYALAAVFAAAAVASVLYGTIVG